MLVPPKVWKVNYIIIQMKAKQLLTEYLACNLNKQISKQTIFPFLYIALSSSFMQLRL